MGRRQTVAIQPGFERSNLHVTEILDRQRTLANAGAQHARQLVDAIGKSRILSVGLCEGRAMFGLNPLLLAGPSLLYRFATRGPGRRRHSAHARPAAELVRHDRSDDGASPDLARSGSTPMTDDTETPPSTQFNSTRGDASRRVRRAAAPRRPANSSTRTRSAPAGRPGRNPPVIKAPNARHNAVSGCGAQPRTGAQWAGPRDLADRPPDRDRDGQHHAASELRAIAITEPESVRAQFRWGGRDPHNPTKPLAWLLLLVFSNTKDGINLRTAREESVQPVARFGRSRSCSNLVWAITRAHDATNLRHNLIYKRTCLVRLHFRSNTRVGPRRCDRRGPTRLVRV